jgi:hypothetical protein
VVPGWDHCRWCQQLQQQHPVFLCLLLPLLQGCCQQQEHLQVHLWLLVVLVGQQLVVVGLARLLLLALVMEPLESLPPLA